MADFNSALTTILSTGLIAWAIFFAGKIGMDAIDDLCCRENGY